MSILVNRHTRVITQGITGATGLFHAQGARDYGTQMVGGVTPGKGGDRHRRFPGLQYGAGGGGALQEEAGRQVAAK